jgi:hypothetical protein
MTMSSSLISSAILQKYSKLRLAKRIFDMPIALAKVCFGEKSGSV